MGFLLAIMIFSATVGVANISFFEAVKIMLSKVPLLDTVINTNYIEDTHLIIIVKLRIPRIIMAALVGAGLSVTGAVYQGIFRNPMADPYVLGVSSGAALGATIAIVFGVSNLFWGVGAIPLFAFLSALITVVFVYCVAINGSKVQTVTLLLSGVAVSFLLSSIISLIMIFNRNHVETIVFWLMGSVSSSGWEQIFIVFPVIFIGSSLVVVFSRDLNIIITGDETARSLGIEVHTVKKILLVICSIMIAACVSFSGIIGFVGLVVPHIFRIITGSDHRILLPFSCLGGAIFMVLADTLARNLIPPIEIPVGIITSMVGAPYFIGLIYKNKKKVF
jgi:iron complex transport system permease protein